MIDHFALLEQPRRPWLDEEELKRNYLEKARSAHPDAQKPGESDSLSSSAINEAYEVLRDPKKRLRHFLELEGVQFETGHREIPEELMALFPGTTENSQKAKQLLEKATGTSSALGKSLLQPELLAMRGDLKAALAILSASYEASLSEIRGVSATWNRKPEQLVLLQNTLTKMTYLQRWITELEEKQFQLSVC
jgi:curved DNA-binding protein CbpA